MVDNDDNQDPDAAIVALIEGDDSPVGPDDFAAPHPVWAGVPPHWGAGEDVVPADNERPADADTLSRDLIVECSHEPQNDTGNGQRLLKHFGADLLQVRNVGWHAWAGTHWEGEGGNEIATRFAQSTAARIVLEADVMAATPTEQKLIDAAADARDAVAAIDKGESTAASRARRQNLVRVVEAGDAAATAVQARQIARRKYSISSGNAGKIRGMIEQALPHRTVTIDELDADKLALNVTNGTIRFVCDEVPDPDAPDHSERRIKRYRVEITEHARGDNITKVAPVEYDPAAKCPAFDTAIRRFQPIAAVREFVQRYHGYSLTGLTGEQCLVFNYGTGSNWKSTFVEIVARIMGPYCATIAFESLSGDQQRSGSQATPDLARLPGARLVRASEPERGVQFKEALIKSLTGGEPMLVRSLNKEFFEFRPDFKMILSGNHKPEIGGVDHGIWRRIRFVPWPVTITDKEKRPMDDVMRELWAERSGILNWLIDGAIDYLNSGLQTPQEVIDATAEYREEMDPVGAFVGVCVDTMPANPDGSSSAFVSARQMYDAFASWANANAVRPWREKNFATAMSQKGFSKERHKSGVRYLNVMLKDVPDAPRRRADEPPPPTDSDIVPI
jgi:putative DNA primase/helicase